MACSTSLWHALLLPPQLTHAQSAAAQVRVWDLRGGSSGTLRFGGTVHHHPLLESISLRAALTAVPGLADQTSIPASAVQWLQVGLGRRVGGLCSGCRCACWVEGT